jgi:hypothetical protein
MPNPLRGLDVLSVNQRAMSPKIIFSSCVFEFRFRYNEDIRCTDLCMNAYLVFEPLYEPRLENIRPVFIPTPWSDSKECFSMKDHL